jgi:DNA-binding LacI/PurR family transcriptional regulator
LRIAGAACPTRSASSGSTTSPTHSLPPLTTVHQDFGEVGRRAVARLIAMLEGDDADGVDGGARGAPAAGVEPWLVVRGSTAPRGGEETM